MGISRTETHWSRVSARWSRGSAGWEQPRLSGVESRLPSGGESRPLRRLPYGLGCCAACSLLLLVWCWLQGSSSLEQPLCCCGLHHAGSPRVSARPCVAVSWLLLGSTQIAIFGRGSP